MQLSLFGLLLLTQPLHSSEQHTRANLEFSSDFEFMYSQTVLYLISLKPKNHSRYGFIQSLSAKVLRWSHFYEKEPEIWVGFTVLKFIVLFKLF